MLMAHSLDVISEKFKGALWSMKQIQYQQTIPPANRSYASYNGFLI